MATFQSNHWGSDSGVKFSLGGRTAERVTGACFLVKVNNISILSISVYYLIKIMIFEK